jgi:hypothetical protein
MRHVLMLTAAIGLLTGAATTASAQKIDDKGKCHDAAGHFAKMDICKGGMKMPMHSYKMDDKGKCHDEKGKFAKKALCSAH